MKRRLFALLLCFLLCVGLLTAQAAETDLPTVTAEQVTALPGETVSAALTLSGNPGVSSLMFAVDYDPVALTLVNASIDSAFASIPGANVLVNDTNAGRVVLSWILLSGKTQQDGVFASLSFLTADTASGVYPLTVTCISGNIFDESLNDIPFTAVNGCVTITAPLPENAAVIMESADGFAGETVTAALTLSGNPGVSSLVLELDYDPEALTLESAAIDSAFSALPGATVLVNDTTAGHLVLSWVLLSGETAQDGAFAHLSFFVAADASGVYPLMLSYRPGNICNEALEDVPFQMVSGAVTVEEAPAAPSAVITGCTGFSASASVTNPTAQPLTAILATYGADGRLLVSQVFVCPAGAETPLILRSRQLASAKLFLLDEGGRPVTDALTANP